MRYYAPETTEMFEQMIREMENVLWVIQDYTEYTKKR
jgi:hypothetical protein